MHFYCKCGKRISDTSDGLSYKASILADQDEGDLFDQIEDCIKNEKLSREKCLDQILLGVLGHYMNRYIYQCQDCGRIYIDDVSGNLHSFLPEGIINKQLLTSVESGNWKGTLWGEWQDEKREWMTHKGFIEVNCNDEMYKKSLGYDNKEEFEQQYYQIFDELKGKKIIRSASLKINGKRISHWNLTNETEKE